MNGCEKNAKKTKASEKENSPAKLMGCLRDKTDPNLFNVRVITKNGRLTAKEHRAVAEAAERFGKGEIIMTASQTLDIQGVFGENIPPLMDFLKEHGLMTGGTGSRVRPVVACKGTTCKNGLLDSYALSDKLHEAFFVGYYQVELPHKFKIAVGGCPNNCAKPDLSDLGIIGQREPRVNIEKCRGCVTCQVEKVCPVGAAELTEGKLQIDDALCTRCGRCKGKCPFGVTQEAVDGYKITIGGRLGRRAARGRALSRMLTSEEEVVSIVERAISLFQSKGQTGERFSDTIERLGFENVEKELLRQ